MINEETARATAKLAALCAKAEHYTGEMDKKLRQWGISTEDRQTVIDYLVTNHYVDDSRYTEAFVEDKIRFNQWGRRKIEQARAARSSRRSTPKVCRLMSTRLCSTMCPTALISNN